MVSRVTLAGNMLYLFIVQFTNYVVPFLVFPYLSRMLSVEGFGLVMTVVSACSIALIITDYGFSLSAPLFISQNRDNAKAINNYIATIYVIKFFLLLIVIFGLISIYFFKISELSKYPWAIFWLGIISVCQSFQPIWFFQGLEKMKDITLTMIASKFLYLILVFLFVNDEKDVNVVFAALFISNMASLVISHVLLQRQGYLIGRPTKTSIINELKQSSSFFVSRSSVGIYTSASTFIVSSFAGMSQAALYSSAEKLYQAGQSAFTPVSQALYPYLARSGDRDIFKKIVLVCVLIIVLISAFCIYWSEDIIVAFFGDAYKSAAEVLNVFLVCLVVTFLSFNYGYPAFAIINKVKVANYTVLVGGVVQLILLSCMIVLNVISPLNVAYSVLSTEIIVLLLRLFLFYHYLNKITQEKK